MNVAAGYVEKAGDVVNLLQLQETQASNQVLLRVRFAEVSRSALTELGVGLFTSPTGVKNTLVRTTTQQFNNAPDFDELSWTKENSEFGGDVTSASGKFTFSDFLNLFLFSQKYDIGAVVKALSAKGLFQSLAEPNLVSESGKEATFLAGGEVPIPIAQGSGGNVAISVQYKEFGVRLSFTPTVIGNRVHLKVKPEVSTLDYSNGVMLQGFRIPGALDAPHRDRARADGRPDVRHRRADEQHDEHDDVEDSRHRRHSDPGPPLQEQAGAEEPDRAGRHDHAAHPPEELARRDAEPAADPRAVHAAGTGGQDEGLAAAGLWPAASRGTAAMPAAQPATGNSPAAAAATRCGR